ncbi:MAG TPA: DNA gyrase subunit A [Clostridiales bacterium]|nr:DNA gyrase subunit A [Clostridiales bacterium]
MPAELSAEFKSTLEKTKLINVEVNNEVKKSFIAYAMAVNVTRAIPDVRDGMKPVHRRILYAMYDMGLTHEKAYKKCAKIVGEVLGKYHPHGDSSVYDALVRLAQDFSINCPLVDGHGNFGSVDGDSAAAYRYTEARLSRLADEMLRDIDKDTVDFYPNFDDTEMQPVVLPSRIPNILVNGSDGIAVGMATNIPPHNLGECIDGCVALLDNPEISTEELMNYIPAPDYPTGGVLMGRAGIKQAYLTGKGGFVLRAKTEIEDMPNGRERIIVTEIPYQVNKEELIKSIASMVNDKRVEGIANLRDESDRHGMRITIELKKDANAQVVLNTLYKHTNLQVKDGIILLALVDGEPKVLGLKQILTYYIDHQESVIVRRTKYDLAKTEDREHIVKGLVIALANIDEVIEIIKHSTDKDDACRKLIEKFELSDKQANAILEMRLQRLTSMEVSKLNEELVELDKTITDLKDILANEWRVKKIIRDDLLAIKEKYPSPRKTELSYDYGEIDIADLIPVQDVVVSKTHNGYLKRVPVSEYRTQHRGGKGVTAHKPKEEDFVDDMFVTSTHDDILFFTDKGRVYSLKCYYIPEAQRTARGRAIVNLLQLSDNEKVCAMIPRKEGTEGYVILATKNGLIKRTSLSEYESIRKVGKIAISIVEGDSLISAQLSSGNDELIVASYEGKCIRFNENDVRAMGREAQGVRSMDLSAGDYVVDTSVIKPGYEVVTMTEHGYGKRSDVEEYRLQSRAGKGVKAGVFNEKTGKLVSLKLVSDSDDLMIITENGTIIRVAAEDVSRFGRDTQGVRVMRIEGSLVAGMAISPKSEEEDGAEETTAE